MLDKKEKVITILTKTCNLIILRNGETEGRMVQTRMSSFTTARCPEITPKIDKLRNNSALLRSMRAKAK